MRLPPIPKNERPFTAAIILLFVVAVSLRFAFLFQVRSNRLFSPAPGTDMFRYERIASEISSGAFSAGTTTESPLYPYVILPAIYVVAQGKLLPARMIQACLASGTVLLICLLARRIFGKRAALFSGVIAAIYAPSIIYDCELLSEWLLNLLCVGLMLYLYLAVHGHEGRPRPLHALAGGLLMGAAAAAKPTILVFLPLAFIWTAAYLHASRRAVMRYLLFMILGIILVVLPFMLRSYLLSGELVPVRGNSGIMFLMGNNPTATGAFSYPTGEVGRTFQELTRGKSQAESDRIAFRLAFDFIRHNPGAFARLWLKKLLMFWSPEEIGNNISVTYFRQISLLRYPLFLSFGLILPLAIAGAIVALKRFREIWLIFAFVFVQMLVIVSFIVVARYRLVIVPFMIILAGAAVDRIVGTFVRRRFGEAALICIAVVGLALGINSSRLYRKAYPLWLSLTGRKCIVKRIFQEFSVRADSDRPTPYTAVLDKSGEMLRKELFVPDWALGDATRADLLMHCAFSPGTKWLLKVNDYSSYGPTPSGKRMGWLRIPLRQGIVRPGENVIVLELRQGRLKAALDDYFDFNRTSMCSPGAGWRSGALDEHTCLKYRSLHIAHGEAVIRLELKRF